MCLVKISNQYINDVTWQPASHCSFSLTDQADIWKIQINENLALLNSFSSLLSNDELIRADKYFQLRDKNRFIISRGALRTILGRYIKQDPVLIEFKKGADQKPYLINSQVCYNISHSGDWIVIAVCQTAIGIDIELIEDSFNFEDIINEYFSLPEITAIKEKELSHQYFYLLWTRKEALTKGTGKGLDDDLKLIPSLDGVYYLKNETLLSKNNWKVTSLNLSDNYRVSVANYETCSGITFWDAKQLWAGNI